MRSAFRAPAIWIGLAVIGGMVLRALRLDWQPLWWDEGYSIYFATEPLRRMVWLTARDIHPPLYYALLHGWFGLTGDTGAVSARLLSILAGTAALPLLAWSARVTFPRRRWLPLWAVVLLALSPFHMYYSQEVRMYGLALALSLASTAAFLRLLAAQRAGQPTTGWLTAYVLLAALSLWTLYYTGLLLMAHQFVALWTFRRDWPKLRPHLLAAAAVLVLQAPWWLYTVPKLLAYVADKVVADEDTALGLLPYLWRHLLALTGGHLTPAGAWTTAVYVAAPVLVFVAPALLHVAVARTSLHEDERRSLGILASSVAVPLAIAFAVSLRLPFFPIGGERLLLFVLPYALLLVAFVLDSLTRRTWLVLLAWLCVLAPSAVGLFTYYATPRYVEDDYRPIVRFVAQHGRDADTVVAIFPWQVGYWRAYSPRMDGGSYLAPQPSPLDQGALVWSPGMAAQLDAALRQGVVWFPAPLSFGRTLPAQIESYLAARGANVDNRWYGAATRLSAWSQTAELASQDVAADFGPVVLAAAGVGPRSVQAANEPVHVDLTWRAIADGQGLRATLRLLDDQDRTWAQRDISPLGSYPAGTQLSGLLVDRVALSIPAGTPPGSYRLAVGVGVSDAEPLFPAPGADYIGLFPLAHVTVTQPEQPLPAARLPAPQVLASRLEAAGIRLVGYDAPNTEQPVMAGTSVELKLFVQATEAHPPARDLAVTLVSSDGAAAAGWQGWPLPAYRVAAWSAGALVTLPVSVDLPADMSPGRYQVVAKLAPDTAAATLTDLAVVRRMASFAATEPSHRLDAPVEFGAHALLIGYDLVVHRDRLDLALHWEVKQPLLPQHHIFVHVDDAAGARIAQQDGPPATAAGLAPTGSWLPGERLITHHTVDISAIAPGSRAGWTIRVGLYQPRNELRLPATVENAAIGDAAILALP